MIDGKSPFFAISAKPRKAGEKKPPTNVKFDPEVV